jgi:segregation and condensation protein A
MNAGADLTEEAPPAPSPASEPRDPADGALHDVIQHLLFQKAMIDDSPSSDDRISRYLGIAHEVEEGAISAYSDPVDRAIATVFDLVAKSRMDPWDIDLGEFARLYLKRISEAATVDFVVAGRILYLAWSVLKMQTERSVVKFQPPPDMAGDLTLDSADIGPSYDESVLAPDAVVLEPVIRRSPQRPVTLIDLVDAFDEVRREIELRAILNAGRIEAVKDLPKFKDRVHAENLEQGITATWERIISRNEEWIPLQAICRSDREDFVTTFIAVLFLAKLGKVELKQDTPAWKIRVPSMVPGYRRGFLAKRASAKKEAPKADAPAAPMLEADGGSGPAAEEPRLGEVFLKNVASGGDIAAEAAAAAEAAKAAQAPKPAKEVAKQAKKAREKKTPASVAKADPTPESREAVG